MKCLILAGGKGDRLWPLSRKNYPKQFIKLQKNHSIFQETVARNLPFCDEFIISTSTEYRFIVENQMQAFSGTPYRCILEEEGRKTTASILLACLELQPSDLIFVVASDHIINGEQYKESIMQAREYARQDKLVTIGMPVRRPDTKFGYIRYTEEKVLDFVEKPDEIQAKEYFEQGNYLINSGIFLFRNDVFLKEVRAYAGKIYEECRLQYRGRKKHKGNIIYSQEQMKQITAEPVEKTVFEHTKKAVVVHGEFEWKDIGTFDDLYATDAGSEGLGDRILYECSNVNIINQCKDTLVVADDLQDITIVNTENALYVGKAGQYENLKKLVHSGDNISRYFETGTLTYRSWGTFEILADAQFYRVKRVLVRSGKTIYSHKHQYRSEQWAIVQGNALIELDGVERKYVSGDTLTVKANMFHQVSNIGEETLIIIEVASGENVREEDVISGDSSDMTDVELGFDVDPIVRLQPTFKDYLWGGTRLREEWGKKCDYSTIAESWEISAHPAGESIVETGRHKGMRFSNYLDILGKEYWGWKCKASPAFPILVKLIDAKENLSVQVHPGDDYALEHENEYGKNEMWYVIDADEGAGLYCGFKHDTTREEVQKHIEDNTILDDLNWIETKPGDVFFIPSGTVHAIGSGNLICEVQQSSNSTYRLYDYNRKDKYGNTRELHLEKALDVLDYQKYTPQKLDDKIRDTEKFQEKLITECKYFLCKKYEIRSDMEFRQLERSFILLICIEGKGEIVCGDKTVIIGKGDSFFIPAGEETMLIAGKCTVLWAEV